MFIILMGAQGSGKGTQASLIGPTLSLDKVATGELFRTAIATETALGLQVKSILEKGDLVPDDVTNNIVRDRICDIAARQASGESNGGLFDGYPRTSAQAESLDRELSRHGSKIDAVIEIEVPRDDLVARLSGRRVCPVCGTIYHIEAEPPDVAGVCDREGAELVQRDDDTAEAIHRRLELYDELTAPLFAYYDAANVLHKVDGNQPIEAVTRAILDVIPGKED